MPYNKYISALQMLRKELDNRIDNEVENCMKGNGDSRVLKEALEYIINTSFVFKNVYKDDEKMK